MAKYVLSLALITFSILGFSQSIYFPPNGTNSWDTVGYQTLGWDQSVESELFQFLDDKNSKAFIVLKDGRIVIEKYFDSFTADSNWYWASAGKTLAAFLIGLAQEQGYLNIHDPVSDYLGTGWTSCDSADESDITIWHQLTMTSGLSDTGGVDVHCTDPQCLECYRESGTRWAYHNAPYTLTHQVVSEAVGKSFNLFTIQNIHNNIGMNGLWIKLGYNDVYFSTARSMARFGLMMLAGGTWDGDTLMHDQQYYHDMINTSQQLNKSYGYLWWLNGKGSYMLPGVQLTFNQDLIPSAPDDLYAGLGAGDQKVYVVPSKGLVVIRLGEDPQMVTTAFDEELWSKLSELMTSPSGTGLSAYQGIQIVPNPASEIIRVKADLPIDVIEIYTLDGQMIRKGNRNFIQVSELDNGIYLVGVKLSNGVQKFGRFVKQ